MKKYFSLSLAVHFFIFFTIVFLHSVVEKKSEILQAYTYQETAVKSVAVKTNKTTLSIKQQNSSANKTTSEQQKNNSEIPLLKILHEAITAKQRYPESAVELHQTGTVTIRLYVYPNGNITDVSLLKSSGVDSIDFAALDAVAAAGPLRDVNESLMQAGYFSVDIVFEV